MKCEGMSTCTSVKLDIVGGLTKGESLKYTLAGQGEPKPRKFYKFWEGGCNRYAIPNNDMRTVLHAIVERVFYVKKDGVFQRPPGFSTSVNRLNQFRKNLVRIVHSLDPCTPEEFCDRYSGNKHRLYVNAAKSLLEQPLEKSDSHIKAFTKSEYLKPGGCPRIIQPRSPRYNVCLGTFLSPNEKTILKGVDDLFANTWGDTEHKTVAKGMNFSVRGQTISRMWDQYKDPVCIGLDAARFDQHINETLLKAEHSIYLDLFGDTVGPVGEVKLSTLLKWQRRNHCSWYGPEGKISYTTKGCRMSGDMNTSLGNILTMCQLWYAFRKETRFNFHLLNDGDDSCIICSRSTALKITNMVEQWFEEFGITMVVEGIYDSLEKVVFCQAQPVFDGTQYYLCPNPHKRCFSDLVTEKDMLAKKTFNLQLGAVAACGLAANGSTPIMNTIYKKMGSGVELFIPDKSHFLYKFRQELVDGMKPEYKEPSLSHRISFMEAFDITPSEQRLLEQFYSKLPIMQHQFCKEREVKIPHFHLFDPIYKSTEEIEGVDADEGRRIRDTALPL